MNSKKINQSLYSVRLWLSKVDIPQWNSDAQVWSKTYTFLLCHSVPVCPECLTKSGSETVPWKGPRGSEGGFSSYPLDLDGVLTVISMQVGSGPQTQKHNLHYIFCDHMEKSLHLPKCSEPRWNSFTKAKAIKLFSCSLSHCISYVIKTETTRKKNDYLFILGLTLVLTFLWFAFFLPAVFFPIYCTWFLLEHICPDIGAFEGRVDTQLNSTKWPALFTWGLLNNKEQKASTEHRCGFPSFIIYRL